MNRRSFLRAAIIATAAPMLPALPDNTVVFGKGKPYEKRIEVATELDIDYASRDECRRIDRMFGLACRDLVFGSSVDHHWSSLSETESRRSGGRVSYALKVNITRWHAPTRMKSQALWMIDPATTAHMSDRVLAHYVDDVVVRMVECIIDPRLRM